MKEEEISSIKDVLKQAKTGPKPPAYPWQDLALKVEREIKIPSYKRGALFKVCKDYPRTVIERCLADTKELCKSGEEWRYFFKAVMMSANQDYTTT